jgi:hypothetical protein
MTIEECLQAATRVEVLLRALYAGLARCFHPEPRVAGCFRDLAADVEQHAFRIRLFGLRRREIFPTDDSVERISRDLLAVRVQLSAMAEDVGHDPDRRSGVRVLKRVVEAERRCGAIHASVIVRCNDPVVSGLFSALVRQDDYHERLLARAQEVGRPAWLRSSPRERPAYAPSWAGGGSFAAAWRAREGRQGAAPWQST